MKSIHNLGMLSISKDIVEDAGFLLTNRKGGYCSFFGNPSSRYHGFFCFDRKSRNMYKFIENIGLAGHDEVDIIKNGFYFAERKKNDAIETFFMPRDFNSLIYELNAKNEIDLVLDCKNSYDNREWGRSYNIFEENGCIIVEFAKKTDKREDSSDGQKEFSLYLAIKSDANSYKKNDLWIERDYYSDRERDSPPFRRYVYNALRLKGFKFVFSVSASKASAIKETIYIFDNLNEIKNREKKNFFNLLEKEQVKKIITSDKINNEIKVAYVCAANSLEMLSVDGKNNYGIFAGLPWFFQFWARDSLVSLKALSKINKEFEEKIIFGCLGRISGDGRLQNLIGDSPKKLGSADAAGWLFVRCRELAEKIDKNKEITNSIKKSVQLIKQNRHAESPRVKEYLKKCSLIISKKEKECHQLLYEIESPLEKSINGLLKFHTKDGFELNGTKETWMDTDFENDGREGIRIELQALRLSMYKLMYDLTLNHKYKILENTLKIKVKNKFWNGKILADGLNDWTIRPNIFIASYVYPELLSQKEWETCFENSLKNLWLGWGGLSTIDKNNKLFTNTNTGENNKSYHRGDSWFWLNNLAAIELNKINNKTHENQRFSGPRKSKGFSREFQKQIQKIISASTEDILWKGCIGCASEISSAKELTSSGCFNQAWSNAMYMEIVDEVYKQLYPT